MTSTDYHTGQSRLLLEPQELETIKEYSALTKDLLGLQKSFGLLSDAIFLLFHRRKLCRHQYIEATMGIGNATLFAPLGITLFGLAVLAYVLFATAHIDRLYRLFTLDISLLSGALTVLTSFIGIYLLLEISGRISVFFALFRGSRDRARGMAPIRDLVRESVLPNPKFGQKNVLTPH